MKKKPRTWIATSLIAAAALAYVIFIFLPRQQAIAERRGELDILRREIVDASRLTASLNAQTKELAAAEQYCETWRREAPQAERLSDLLGAITADAQAAGVTITSVEPGLVENYDTLTAIPLKLKFDGDFEQIFAFLAKLDNRAAAVVVVDVRLAALANGAGDGSRRIIRCHASLTVFADYPGNSD